MAQCYASGTLGQTNTPSVPSECYLILRSTQFMTVTCQCTIQELNQIPDFSAISPFFFRVLFPTKCQHRCGRGQTAVLSWRYLDSAPNWENSLTTSYSQLSGSFVQHRRINRPWETILAGYSWTIVESFLHIVSISIAFLSVPLLSPSPSILQITALHY